MPEKLTCESKPVVFNEHSVGWGTALDDIERSVFQSQMDGIDKMSALSKAIVAGYSCEEPCAIGCTLTWTMGKSRTEEDGKLDDDILYKSHTRIDWVLTVECRPRSHGGGGKQKFSPV